MIDAPDRSLAELRGNAEEFEQSLLQSEANEHQANAAIPNREALGFLLFDSAGRPISMQQAAWAPDCKSFAELQRYVDERSPDRRLLHFPRKDGPPCFGLWAPYAETEGWNLPASLRHVAENGSAAFVALFTVNSDRPIEAAVAGFGLTGLQQKVIAEVVRAGSVRRAAVKAGLAYATARHAAVEAARHMHLPNTPAVVTAVVAAAFGVLPGDAEGPEPLADMLHITDRQARIALLISSGVKREDAAQAIGCTTAVVKKELQLLFATFGVQTSIDLARIVTEAKALRSFARTIDNAPGFLDASIEPSRVTVRPNNRGSFSWSDYGPGSGKPVLVVHSNWCCRAVPRPLLTELQRNGWRPIAIDRPGFGASDLGSSTSADPFSQAIADALQLLDAARIQEVPIIARCGAQFVHAFKTATPDRVGAVVLVSPTPQATASGSRFGPVGAFKEAFYRSPRLIELFFRVISSQFSFERVEYLMRSITRGCETDERLCEDPQFIRDRFRALRPFACGNFRGGINEEHVISHGGYEFKPLDVNNWCILQGADDHHNSLDEVEAYWRKLLPNTPSVAVPRGGRFLTSSHATVVVDRLHNLQPKR
jgi:pimeloyl-ACP methyl ester carboxylesterase